MGTEEWDSRPIQPSSARQCATRSRENRFFDLGSLGDAQCYDTDAHLVETGRVELHVQTSDDASRISNATEQHEHTSMDVFADSAPACSPSSCKSSDSSK